MVAFKGVSMSNLMRETPKGAAICRSCRVPLKGVLSTLLSDSIGGKRVRAFICDKCIYDAYMEILWGDESNKIEDKEG